MWRYNYCVTWQDVRIVYLTRLVALWLLAVVNLPCCCCCCCCCCLSLLQISGKVVIIVISIDVSFQFFPFKFYFPLLPTHALNKLSTYTHTHAGGRYVLQLSHILFPCLKHVNFTACAPWHKGDVNTHTHTYTHTHTHHFHHNYHILVKMTWHSLSHCLFSDFLLWH